jgi:tetratricopeptide (TPR) repeat protein
MGFERWIRGRRLEIHGKFDDALDALPGFDVSGADPVARSWIYAARARVLHSAGRTEAALEAFRGFRVACMEVPGSRFAGVPVGSLQLCALDDALLALADAEYLAGCAAYFAAMDDDGGVQETTTFGVSLPRLAGLLDLHFDRLESAETRLRHALAWCGRERCPIEAGRCHQGLAEVAERRGDHTAALEHLERAGALFSQHGARLFLDQVLAKKEILKA